MAEGDFVTIGNWHGTVDLTACIRIGLPTGVLIAVWIRHAD
ncbi:MAG: hypothetical protein MO846_11875 [Candidatus Devosia symbiotica]|nr:hypothetical protein [Candidatus Devosia symbiotica]